MRVLVLHNHYRQFGGEDAVADAEVNLLRSRGLDVFVVDANNDANPRVDLKGALGLALNSHWSRESYDGIRRICREFRPDVAHVHNFWMRLTPAVHAACRDEGVATVQTLHNFRLFCTNAQFQRSGHRCEDCLGRVPWRGVLRRCYRKSFFASAAVARMIVSNRRRRTWMERVNAFIALSEHSRALFIAGGIPEELIRIKPNFVEDRSFPRAAPSESNEFLFVGRLSEEKGVGSLLTAWASSELDVDARLTIVGDGPERASLEKQASELGITKSVSFLGYQPPAEVLPLLGQARAVIMPSLFHECFPRTLAEAMSAGRPVIASSVGALDELVSGEMGIQFEPLDTAALARAIERLYRDGAAADQFGLAARATYLARYTPELNFETLMQIYDFARGHSMAATGCVAVGGPP